MFAGDSNSRQLYMILVKYFITQSDLRLIDVTSDAALRPIPVGSTYDNRWVDREALFLDRNGSEVRVSLRFITKLNSVSQINNSWNTVRRCPIIFVADGSAHHSCDSGLYEKNYDKPEGSSKPDVLLWWNSLWNVACDSTKSNHPEWHIATFKALQHYAAELGHVFAQSHYKTTRGDHGIPDYECWKAAATNAQGAPGFSELGLRIWDVFEPQQRPGEPSYLSDEIHVNAHIWAQTLERLFSESCGCPKCQTADCNVMRAIPEFNGHTWFPDLWVTIQNEAAAARRTR